MVARSIASSDGPRAGRAPVALLAGTLLVLVAALGLKGCGDSTGGPPEGASPPPGSPSESPSEAAASTPGGGSRGRGGAPRLTPTDERPLADAAAGGIHGTIRFEGTPPKRFELGAVDLAECKHHPEVDQRRNDVVVNDGKLAGVFVTLDGGVDRSAVPPTSTEAVTLEQKGCMYVPRVVALRVGQTLRVTNEDPAAHNVHLRAKRNQELNRNMGKGEPALEFRFERAERPMPLACDIHPWMGAAVFVEEHPWFAVTDEQGSFSIEGIPPGDYELVAMHETLKKASGTITVKAGASVGVTLTLAGK